MPSHGARASAETQQSDGGVGSSSAKAAAAAGAREPKTDSAVRGWPLTDDQPDHPA